MTDDAPRLATTSAADLPGNNSGAASGKPGENRPMLWRDGSFWGMTATQFLGAFNDNVFKQALMLLAISTGGDKPVRDLQWVTLLVFASPFLLFSSFAGYLSEIYSKRTVIVLSKVAEIVAMLLGAVAFALYTQLGMFGLMVVLFLMGAQSAFFGPAKYGILPEILRPRDLGRANGMFLMTTFLAIIFGVAAAGPIVNFLGGSLHWAAGICVAIAVVGTLTSLLVRPVPAASPDLTLDWEAVTVPRDVRTLLRNDRPLILAAFASCVFWMVGGLVQPSVNALGKLQLLVGHPAADMYTSLLAASVGVGIAAGCLGAGFFSRDMVNFKLVRIGLWGIVVCLFALCLPGADGSNLLGYGGSLACLLLLGVFTGMFAVPLQVFIQSRPPEGMKGRLIATVNLANWVAIVAAALVYFVMTELLRHFLWAPSTSFAFIALLLLPLAIFYRPRNEHV
ncbi:MFS transporter [Lignipirellula cremea]|uniref:Lysophospholipid transporter LplT n=1 Tax=Lignipirellula cremea TaxID=2528010 RepID=A0A518DZA0_9BACT|nr:MFS transporter [Lignipirellula cremea]QDU97162.1 Lysophospholipid transporter LplT [Lignipirellula cremea]